MNLQSLHPLVVHFPIALLSLYGLFELMSIRRLAAKPYWFYVKAVLIVGGSLGAVASFFTGKSGINYNESSALIQAHINFAQATMILSILIALIYIIAWVGRDRFQLLAWKFLANRGAMIPLSLAIIALIFITGGLGGAIVYGTDFDPFMRPIFNLLNIP